MGYNYDISSFKKVQSLLEALLEGKRTVFETESPGNFAFLLRQGIKSAEANEVEEYKDLDFRFLVRPGKVIAEPRKYARTVAQRGSTKERVMRVTSKMTHFDVVVHVQEHGDREELIYANFIGEPELVERWCENNGWHLVSKNPLHIAKNAKAENDE